MAKANKDHIKKLHEYYQNGYSYKKLATESTNIVGVDLNLNDVRAIGRSNNWTRVNTNSKAPHTNIEEMNINVLNILYESIILDWESGQVVDAQKINSFTSLQHKLGDIGQTIGNGKSDLQQVLEHLEN